MQRLQIAFQPMHLSISLILACLPWQVFFRLTAILCTELSHWMSSQNP
jgi:hypothetical protein